MAESFLKIATKLPNGETYAMELDEQAAKDALVEMESWGEDLGDDAREMRQALRDHFNGRK